MRGSINVDTRMINIVPQGLEVRLRQKCAFEPVDYTDVSVSMVQMIISLYTYLLIVVQSTAGLEINRVRSTHRAS